MALKGWREILIGGMITDGGNSINYKTGDWRSYRPIWDDKKCNNCKVCWVYCPDGSIVIKDGVVSGMDLDHCKGCGICAQECPQKAIEMMEETKLREAVK
jgi:pyruvate ferredoxin oxidoreductase delta subunit